MKNLPFVEQFHKPKRRTMIWNWVKENQWYVVAQAACIACAPIVFFLSEMSRGYRGFGSEVLLIIAPTIYKIGKYILEYDED